MRPALARRGGLPVQDGAPQARVDLGRLAHPGLRHRGGEGHQDVASRVEIQSHGIPVFKAPRLARERRADEGRTGTRLFRPRILGHCESQRQDTTTRKAPIREHFDNQDTSFCARLSP